MYSDVVRHNQVRDKVSPSAVSDYIDSGRAGFYRTEQANAGCSVSVAFMPNLRACSGRGPDTVSSAPSGELLVNYCILSHLSFI